MDIDPYNGQPGGQEPDWRLFDAIEVRPMTQVLGGVDEEDAVLESAGPCDPIVCWSVFGHYAKQDEQAGCDLIGDFPRREQAVAAAQVMHAKLPAPVCTEPQVYDAIF